ncbi:MAG: hypothetical protein OEM00_10285 [Burkholderiaceae bacterium]|nr:hypothetical protein [Burkholderiaceae bacterium]
MIKVSDVALLGRLRGSGEWFRWMVEQMSCRLSATSQEVLPGKRVRLVDASVVCEPGATGSTWRLHYMIDLSTLACEQLLVTSPEEGETLTRPQRPRADAWRATSTCRFTKRRWT